VIKLSWNFFEGCEGNKIIRLTLIGGLMWLYTSLWDKDKWVSPVSKSLNIAQIIVIIVGTCLQLWPEKKNMSKTE